MNRVRFARSACACAVLALLAGLSASLASAQSTWTGGNSTGWSDSSNWSVSVPGSADVALFSSSTTYTNQPAINNPASVGGLWYTGGAPLTISGEQSLTLNGTTIGANPGITGIAVDPGAGPLTIAAPVTLSADQTWVNNSSNPCTVSGAVNNGNSNLTIAGSGAATFSGPISGPLNIPWSPLTGGSLTVNGPAQVTLTNTNTFGSPLSGLSTQVNGGTLTLASNGAANVLPSESTVNVNSGMLAIVGTATNYYKSPDMTTVYGAVDSSNLLQVFGGAVLSVATSASGTDFQKAENPLGTIYLDGTNGSAAVVMSPNGSGFLAGVFQAGDYAISGMAWSSYIDSIGAVTNIWGANLRLVNNSLASPFDISAATFDTNGRRALNTINITGTIDDYTGFENCPLLMDGGGIVIFSGSNTYGGTTTISAGTLQIGNGGATGTPGTGDIENDAVLAFSRSDNGLVVANNISGGGSVVNIGPGLVNLSGNNTYQGPTIISAGTLQIGSATAIPRGPATGNVTVSSSAVLDVNGFVTNVNGLTGAGIVDNSSASSGTLVVGNNNASCTFDGVLQNSSSAAGGLLALAKVGTGALRLTGANTYLGGTTVAGGTLQLGNPSALGSGPLAANGGTLDMEGNSLTVTSFSGAAGTVTDYGMSYGTTTLTVKQSTSTTFGGTIANGPTDLLALSLTGSGTLTLSGTNTYTGGTTVANGMLVLTNNEAIADGTSLTVGDPSAFSHAPVVPEVAVASGTPIAPVPEPGTLALLIAGAMAAGWSTWRRSKGAKTEGM